MLYGKRDALKKLNIFLIDVLPLGKRDAVKLLSFFRWAVVANKEDHAEELEGLPAVFLGGWEARGRVIVAWCRG